MTAKVLTLDLETSPILAHVWGLWDQNVGLSQLLQAGEVICFAAKWEHEDKVRFHRGPTMIAAAHKLLDQADFVVTFNGVSFDQKWLQSEFVKAGLTPPSPYASIDLLRVVKAKFRFPSNKLAYVSQELLGESKAPTGGHELWIQCMAGNKEAWKRMRSYNEQDVLLTERLYQRLKPWIKVPSPALYGGADLGEITCPGCGSNDMRKRGLSYTALSAYQRYRCQDCGRYAQGKNRLLSVNAR